MKLLDMRICDQFHDSQMRFRGNPGCNLFHCCARSLLGSTRLRFDAAGKTVPEALLAGNENPGVRQAARIDASGNVLAHRRTCIEAAGNQTGKDYSVQANLMSNITEWPEMANAFENATGSLAERMLAGLDPGKE